MKIRITLNHMHPYFGGHEITTWDYDMADGEKAAAHYRKLRQEVGTNPYATAEIFIVHLG